jgi:hypothetical protein
MGRDGELHRENVPVCLSVVRKVGFKGIVFSTPTHWSGGFCLDMFAAGCEVRRRLWLLWRLLLLLSMMKPLRGLVE